MEESAGPGQRVLKSVTLSQQFFRGVTTRGTQIWHCMDQTRDFRQRVRILPVANIACLIFPNETPPFDMSNRRRKCWWIGLSILLIGLITGCDLGVLGSETEYNEEDILEEQSATLVATGMLETGFDAVETMWFIAGLVDSLEVQPTSGQATLAEVSTANEPPPDNLLNRGGTEDAYKALSLADKLLTNLDQNTFGETPEADQKAKQLLEANVRFMQGIIYTTFARYYESVVVRGTGESIAPDQALERGIQRLRRAEEIWENYRANQARLPISEDGLVVGDSTFVNSYVGMLRFDRGERAQAEPLLENGYTSSHAGQEVTFNTINELQGPGVYLDLSNFFVLGGAVFSPSFRANRIPGDTLRGSPRDWFAQTALSYFYPGGPVPIVSWQEVALMRAELADSESERENLVQTVLESWNIPPSEAATLAMDASITPERVARYEHFGRGRAWHTGDYRRWPLSSDLNL